MVAGIVIVQLILSCWVGNGVVAVSFDGDDYGGMIGARRLEERWREIMIMVTMMVRHCCLLAEGGEAGALNFNVTDRENKHGERGWVLSSCKCKLYLVGYYLFSCPTNMDNFIIFFQRVWRMCLNGNFYLFIAWIIMCVLKLFSFYFFGIVVSFATNRSLEQLHND